MHDNNYLYDKYTIHIQREALNLIYKKKSLYNMYYTLFLLATIISK